MSIERIFPTFPELSNQPSRDFIVRSANAFDLPVNGKITVDRIELDSNEAAYYGEVSFVREGGKRRVSIPFVTQEGMELQTKEELEKARGDKKETAAISEPSYYFLDTEQDFGCALLGLVSSKAAVLEEISRAKEEVLQTKERWAKINACIDNTLSIGGSYYCCCVHI